MRAHTYLRRIAGLRVCLRVREENYLESLARAIPSIQNRFCINRDTGPMIARRVKVAGITGRVIAACNRAYDRAYVTGRMIARRDQELAQHVKLDA